MKGKNNIIRLKLKLRVCLLFYLHIFIWAPIQTTAEITNSTLKSYTKAILTDSIRSGDIYSTEIKGDEGEKISTARYTLFIPKGLVRIKGVFIHQHGCTMEGTGAPVTTDLQYQAFAEKWGLALLGPDLTPHNNDCMEWSDPENGSDISLQEGLNDLAHQSGHQELAQAPWLLWGHSGGGNWVLSMISKHPERIIAAFCYSPAFNIQFNFPKLVDKIPIMIRHAGSGDYNDPGIECWETALDIFSTIRSMNGLISVAYTSNQTHNFSYVRYMGIPFYESVLAQRLPLDGSEKLRDMNTAKSWLGDTSSINTMVYKASTFQGDQLSKSWLPDSACAEKYKEYIMTGTVKDVTYPPPPSNVRINNTDDKTFEITWQAKADIESGIKCFLIYKNNKFMSRYPETSDFQKFDTNGDNPIPAIAPVMSYRIAGQLRKGTDIYEVSVVNHGELESLKIKAEF